MNIFISMLRGINVSGQKPIRMAELKNLYEGLGFFSVHTYVQSGNVIFESHELDSVKLVKKIEAQIEQFYGYSVTVFIRTQDDFERIIQNNPFLISRNEDPTRLHITFLYSSPSVSKLNELSAPQGEKDEFFIREKEVYLFCPNGYGRTKLSNNFFEKKLAVPATTRNWNTVNALYRLTRDLTQ